MAQQTGRRLSRRGPLAGSPVPVTPRPCAGLGLLGGSWWGPRLASPCGGCGSGRLWCTELVWCLGLRKRLWLGAGWVGQASS